MALRTALRNFTRSDRKTADLFRVLGHPARLQIMRVLAARGTCVCGEIVEVLPLSQSTVSEHLKVLKDAGLIRGEISGVRSCYCIDATGFRHARSLGLAFLEGLEVLDNECC